METVIELDLLCVFVTFVDEMASLGPTVVSMTSTIVPENPAERTYKVVRKPADGLAYALAHRREARRHLQPAQGKARLVKAHLLHADADFDFTAELAPQSDDLVQDLELDTVLGAWQPGTRSCSTCAPARAADRPH